MDKVRLYTLEGFGCTLPVIPTTLLEEHTNLHIESSEDSNSSCLSLDVSVAVCRLPLDTRTSNRTISSPRAAVTDQMTP